MNGGKITIEVGLCVSDDDAAASVVLLQLYLKNHPEKCLEFTMNDDGETQIHIVDKRGDGWGCIAADEGKKVAGAGN